MRMSKRPLILLLLAAFAVSVVAVPSVALGQSAGDDQYVDPFDDGDGGGGGNDNAQSGGDDAVAQAPTDTGTTTDTGDTAGTTATESATGDTLPRTGLDVGPIVLTGFLLLISGLALRRLGRIDDRVGPVVARVAGMQPVPRPAPAPAAVPAAPKRVPELSSPAEPAGLPARAVMLIGVLAVGGGMTLRRIWRSPS
jgi:hypothetical protein